MDDCSLCGRSCARRVEMFCCSLPACRTCAVAKLVSTEKCWNTKCAKPANTFDLVARKSAATCAESTSAFSSSSSKFIPVSTEYQNKTNKILNPSTGFVFGGFLKTIHSKHPSSESSEHVLTFSKAPSRQENSENVQSPTSRYPLPSLNEKLHKHKSAKKSGLTEELAVTDLPTKIRFCQSEVTHPSSINCSQVLEEHEPVTSQAPGSNTSFVRTFQTNEFGISSQLDASESTEWNPEVLNCDICKDICKRAVLVPCCKIQACNGCAVLNIIRGGNCWVCTGPLRSKDLLNHKYLRIAVETFKKNGKINANLQTILAQKQTFGDQDGASNQKTLNSDGILPDTKDVKTEFTSVEEHKATGNKEVTNCSLVSIERSERGKVAETEGEQSHRTSHNKIQDNLKTPETDQQKISFGWSKSATPPNIVERNVGLKSHAVPSTSADQHRSPGLNCGKRGRTQLRSSSSPVIRHTRKNITRKSRSPSKSTSTYYARKSISPSIHHTRKSRSPSIHHTRKRTAPKCGRSKSPSTYYARRSRSPEHTNRRRSKSPGTHCGRRSRSPEHKYRRSKSPSTYYASRSRSPAHKYGWRSKSRSTHYASRSRSPAHKHWSRNKCASTHYARRSTHYVRRSRSPSLHHGGSKSPTLHYARRNKSPDLNHSKGSRSPHIQRASDGLERKRSDSLGWVKSSKSQDRLRSPSINIGSRGRCDGWKRSPSPSIHVQRRSRSSSLHSERTSDTLKIRRKSLDRSSSESWTDVQMGRNTNFRSTDFVDKENEREKRNFSLVALYSSEDEDKIPQKSVDSSNLIETESGYWEKIKRLKTDQDRLWLAKTEFGNPVYSDPGINLTFHGYKRKKVHMMQSEDVDSFYDFYTNPDIVRLKEVKSLKRQKFYIHEGKLLPMPGYILKDGVTSKDVHKEIIDSKIFKTLIEKEFYQKFQNTSKKVSSRVHKRYKKPLIAHFKTGQEETMQFLKFYKSEFNRSQVEEAVYLEKMYISFSFYYGETKPLYFKTCKFPHLF